MTNTFLLKPLVKNQLRKPHVAFSIKIWICRIVRNENFFSSCTFSALAMDVPITPNLVANGILSFVAINFFLLLSLWTKLAGLLAMAFVVVLCQGWNGFLAHDRDNFSANLETGTRDESALISQVRPRSCFDALDSLEMKHEVFSIPIKMSWNATFKA